ncbi:MAG: glutaredoxin family protein [SAR202 cluster bacterium]|jgi:glutaredoxin|nr:NrdH-redoxin [Chloroflexota bacterium]MDP6421721.1 glutaredoxin family protein [SAR202 cluster bacterium]HAL47765.1 NrdH-redoxin [Dehalococcoidia bacterium]MDP6663302.1 glutaredoxin family protein [SAR202 cluster bacterium]MDP6801464.1 glutaredoxin family protein [SAR202 cluster bacterium]|tara:strand:+ start:178 stop:375 length:198 start_codon:yes stop_codon:yes gene_type:complete
MVKVYLSRKDIPFTELNVSLDRDALKNLVTMGYRTTPVTIIGDEKVVGYSPSKLEAALQSEGITA